MTQLRGAHAVVTGGSSGIGLTIAARLAERGFLSTIGNCLAW